ncbi:hypothetical protein BO86DRAFT_239989 [Aspergillus japonicus CBS 114.51]|uniref:UBZ4-type domain-containing protein n=1 Tax=Aspergillus japonicus CBS 114.51 TaxID=1448312 RepID=A0A8T8X9X7_ASPJA|nr:hypothetical protein BO86DRAFT_239989 [Aspergillus japonicus CBS 114.51]RAH84322.1 hypothetical protein BO86DRAFT_239989 [Aspergillus japonicus CBS 114.51]
MPRVPTTKEVLPGANVNIVLKADQPTGRTVSGTIADVLTRGNHPRGIKVRLTDGRVGRVQSMSAGSGGQSADPAALEPAEFTSAAAEFSRGRGSQARRTEADEPPRNIGLDAYITKPSRQKRRGGRGEGAGAGGLDGDAVAVAVAAAAAPVVTCPVCGVFEGDEAAVAYHVASHFAD